MSLDRFSGIQVVPRWGVHAGVVLLGAVIVLLPALINGFPFVYSDTGTYILSAFKGYLSFDRPFWYGPFVYGASLGGLSLWGVAVVQALLCVVYMFRTTGLLVDPGQVTRTFLLSCAAVTLFSGLGWYAARLIPDIFTGIGLLAMFTMLHPLTSLRWRLVDVAVVVAACWFHSSNLLILPLAGFIALLLLRPKGYRALGAVWLGITVIGAWGGAALANYGLTGTAYVSRNSHVFLMGRMVDSGMLKVYLEEHCRTHGSGICRFQDSLPEVSSEFLWNERSPLWQQGGWDATEEEYNAIVMGSFTQFRYLKWHATASVRSTLEQLTMWSICDNMRSTWYRSTDSAPYTAIAGNLPSDLPGFMGSLQNGGWGELDMHWPDRFYRFGLVASLITSIWWFRPGRRTSIRRGSERFLIYSIISIVVAAWVCASLSVADTRYLSRDSWLLPFAAILVWAPTSGVRVAEQGAIKN